MAKRPMTFRDAALAALKPALLALGAIVYAALRIISAARPIRMGLLRSERIGHLAINSEIYLRRRASDPARRGEIGVFLSARPCNRQLLTMIARRVRVIETRWAVGLYQHAILPWIQGTRFEEPLTYTGHDFAPFQDAPRQLGFTPDEERRGQELLRSMGIGPEEPFVCFAARDKAYLDTRHTHKSRAEWSYQDWRDCRIENYLAAAVDLAERGVYMLRMGSVVQDPLPSAHPRIIDYAAKHRSDFGDIYLAAHCQFFLGSESGLTSLPGCFDVPVAAANLAPIGYAPLGAADVYILKKYRTAASGRAVSFRELIALGADRWLRSETFEGAGLELMENSPEEILELAREMSARLDHTWNERPGDRDLQDRFHALFPAGHPMNGFPSRLGAHFLRANANLLE